MNTGGFTWATLSPPLRKETGEVRDLWQRRPRTPKGEPTSLVVGGQSKGW